jgi:hypothetical protein
VPRARRDEPPPTGIADRVHSRRDIVIEDAPAGGTRVNRINYEICVLRTLRERLRCKEILSSIGTTQLVISSTTHVPASSKLYVQCM